MGTGCIPPKNHRGGLGRKKVSDLCEQSSGYRANEIETENCLPKEQRKSTCSKGGKTQRPGFQFGSAQGAARGHFGKTIAKITIHNTHLQYDAN